MLKSVIALALLSNLAHADELTPPRDHGYIAGAAVIGAHAVDAITGYYNLDGAVRLPNTPLLARGLVGTGEGRDGNADTRTSIRQWRIGLELDQCSANRTLCFFAGIDVGRATIETLDRETEMTTDESQRIQTLRLGFDAGGRYLGARVAIDLGDAAGFEVGLIHRFF